MTQEIQLFKQQFDAFNFTTQFGAAIGGVQSGKTFLGACWSGKKINEFPDKDGAIIAPTYKILQQSTLNKLFQQFPQLRPYYKEQKGVIELPTGGHIYIRSADQPYGLEGMTLHWIWMDEAGQMSRMAWTVARSRVARTNGQILITTTPYTLNWLYEDFFLKWQRREDPQLSVFTWKSTDNPDFSREFYEAEKRRLSPEEFARRYEGTFTKMEGLVYDLPAEQIIEPKEIPNVKDIILGLDFGFHNPAAAVVIKITTDNVWYVVGELYKPELTQDELEDNLRAMRLITPYTLVYPDPAEPKALESMKRKGFQVRTVDKNVVLGINRVRELIRNKQLYVFNTCKNVLDEFNSYHYDPEKLKEEPVKEKDHAMDALRYAVYNYSGPRLLRFEVQGGVPNYYEGIAA